MSKKTTNQPNIIFILADDHGAWATGCYGNKEVITPSLDKLAEEGIKFNNFYCTSPVCSPARASILTGKLPSQHGVHDWVGGGNINIQDHLKTTLKIKRCYPYFDEEEMEKYVGDRSYDEIGEDETMPFSEFKGYKAYLKRETTPYNYLDNVVAYTELLKDNGYSCGLSGKWHLGNSASPQKGFDFWRVISGGGTYYNYPEYMVDGYPVRKEDYVSDIITDDAIEFIENNKDNPFYIGVHYTAPHSPWAELDQKKELWDLYEDCKFDSAPIETPHPNQAIHRPIGKTPELRRQYLRGYYSALTGMDNGINKIMEKLQELNIDDNTIIIYTSDNGMNLGHHGIWGKGNGTYPMNMFDTSVKVPTLMKVPGVKNIVSDDLLSHYDIMPTLLDYLNIDFSNRNELPGKSFVELLKGNELEENHNVVIYDEYGPVRMIRSKEWKYVHRYPDGPHELFDMVNDPDERNNLIDDPNQQSRVEQLRNELIEWFKKHVVKDIDGSKLPVTGEGQFDLAIKGGKSF